MNLLHFLLFENTCIGTFLDACRDARLLVLEPMERMVDKVKQIAENPLALFSSAGASGPGGGGGGSGDGASSCGGDDRPEEAYRESLRRGAGGWRGVLLSWFAWLRWKWAAAVKVSALLSSALISVVCGPVNAAWCKIRLGLRSGVESALHHGSKRPGQDGHSM